MSEYTMTIDGKAVAGEGSQAVINPSTGEVFAHAPNCSRAQLDLALESAADAYKVWKRDEGKRRQALLDCAEVINANAQELGRVLSLEQGKPLARAVEEIQGSAMWFQVTSALEIPVEVVQDTPEARIEVHRRPLGVVGAITPWNFPVLLGVWKIAPALLAGNTVVLKPSPYTPLSSLELGRVLRDVLPPGVLNFVSGGDELGSWMTAHPIPRKISFTGSVETGKKVAAASAPDLKRLTLELGGNDAAILLDDVDPAAIADKLFWGAFANSGQICSAIKRVYAPEALYRPILEGLAERARQVKVGDGLDPESELGPINNKPQFERVCELVEDAKAQGAEVMCGGDPIAGDGYFFQPTILGGLAEGTRIVDEEQFGPALPVIPYRDVDDAVARANATQFGLSGSVWSADTARAADIASELECGTAWVNQHLQILPHTPFGGAKWSGIGVENGPWGLMGFTEIQTLNIAKQ